MIDDVSQILSMRCEPAEDGSEKSGDTVPIRLKPEVAVDPGRFRRNFYTTSSCGVCGKLAMGAVEVRPSRTMRKSGPQFRADLIRLLPDLPGRKMCNWTTAVMECDRQIFYFPDLGPT
jgi:formate dehydrogenase assembly factor FdhD